MKEFKGIVVCSPMEIRKGEIIIKRSNLDPQELRSSLLLWDKIVWPRLPSIDIESNAEAMFLESEGILNRPLCMVDENLDLTNAEEVALSQVAAFRELDAREPGQWSFSQGDNSFLLKNGTLLVGDGSYIELAGAIPVPNVDVSLDDILEFKKRREAELAELQSSITTLSQTINQNFSSESLEQGISQVDKACADVLKASLECQFPFRMSTLKASLDIRPTTPFATALPFYLASSTLELSATAAALTGAGLGVLSWIKLSKEDFKWHGLRKRLGPYRYVRSFHREVFGQRS